MNLSLTFSLKHAKTYLLHSSANNSSVRTFTLVCVKIPEYLGFSLELCKLQIGLFKNLLFISY